MNQENVVKWCKCQNKAFTKNEFELMLRLYTGEHINLKNDIIGKCKFLPERKTPPQDSLIAKGMIERNGLNGYGYNLTSSGWSKMENIEKLVEKNCLLRCLYKWNQYPVAISLISTIAGTILGAIITLIGQRFSK